MKKSSIINLLSIIKDTWVKKNKKTLKSFKKRNQIFIKVRSLRVNDRQEVSIYETDIPEDTMKGMEHLGMAKHQLQGSKG